MPIVGAIPELPFIDMWQQERIAKKAYYFGMQVAHNS
jgi:hypothetical protein